MRHYPQTTHVALTKRRQADINGMNYYCLFLSLKCCPYGYEGKYLCTLPMNAALLPDNSKDCFAQEKFSDYHDNMGGVVAFTRQNRTLYVGTGEETEETAEASQGMG